MVLEEVPESLLTILPVTWTWPMFVFIDNGPFKQDLGTWSFIAVAVPCLYVSEWEELGNLRMHV